MVNRNLAQKPQLNQGALSSDRRGFLRLLIWTAVGGVLFPALLIMVLALVPRLDRSRQPVHYMANPFERLWVTGLGLTGIVFFGLLGTAGYMDVLGLPLYTMAWIVAMGTVGSGILFIWILKKLPPDFQVRRKEENNHDGRGL